VRPKPHTWDTDNPLIRERFNREIVVWAADAMQDAADRIEKALAGPTPDAHSHDWEPVGSGSTRGDRCRICGEWR